MVEKTDKLLIGKIFGILSIVFAFISSWGLGGIILGIIGLIQLKGEKKELTKKVRRLNVLGIIFGSIILIISFVALIIMILNGGFDLTNSFLPK